MTQFDTAELTALTRDLGRAGKRAEQRTKTAVRKIGHDVITAAQNLVPVDTGNLKSSLAVDIDADGLGFEAGSEVLYAGYVEYGTTRMAPQPYLNPAFDEQIPTAMTAFEQILGRTL